MRTLNRDLLRQIFRQVANSKIDYLEKLEVYFNEAVLYTVEGKNFEKRVDSKTFGNANMTFYSVNNQTGSRANLTVTKTLGDSLPNHLKKGTKIELAMNATNLLEHLQTGKSKNIATAYVDLNGKPLMISFEASYEQEKQASYVTTKVVEGTYGAKFNKVVETIKTPAVWNIKLEEELER